MTVKAKAESANPIHLALGPRARSLINAPSFIVLASTTLTAASHKTQAPAPAALQVTELVQKDVPIHREWTGSLDELVNAEIHPQVPVVPGKPPFGGVLR
jgi:hypothetical protein